MLELWSSCYVEVDVYYYRVSRGQLVNQVHEDLLDLQYVIK